MIKTVSVLSFITAVSILAFAHDEGHGPKLSDAGKYGGLVSPVVKASDAKLGAKAGLVYKAELVRSGDGTVRIYLYDKAMKPLDVTGFEPNASGHLGVRIKGKSKEISFPLELKENAFVGKMPRPEANPYDIDVHLKSAGTALLSAFDNLD